MLGMLRVIRASSHARWEWFKEKAQTAYARRWLGAYSFFESLILPFPTDVFLAMMVHADRRRAVHLTILTTLTSVLGAVVAYFIAYFFYTSFGEPIALYLGIADEVVRIAETLNHYAFVATFIGAFTPIPYTPVILAAGILRADFFAFLVASLLGRGLRYSLVSICTVFFGVSLLPVIEQYTARVTFLIVGIALCVFGIVFILW
jgi:membrane protein YqaA with SNARE-associated domain